MTTIKTILIILFAGILQQCSYSQNNSNSSTSKKENMDSVQKKHALYSNTDTAKVNVSDSELGKSVAARCVLCCPQKRNGKSLVESPSKRYLIKELIIVRFAAMPFFKVTQNLKAVVAGPAFMNLSVKEALSILRIIPMV